MGPTTRSKQRALDQSIAEQDSILSATPSKPQDEEPEAAHNDSDDEAPEAVSTSQAASDVKKAAQLAAQAVKEQAVAQKRKRQQRDEMFKQQAQIRKTEADAKRTRTDKIPVPDLLPAEVLTESSDEGEQEDEDGVDSRSRRRKRNVAAVEGKLSRLDKGGDSDEKVGATVYRVAKRVDERMAPRTNKYARGSKEALLKRGRTAVKTGSGFLKR